jgi:hypothetical protein
MIKDLNQLANRSKGDYVNEGDVLNAIRNNFKTGVLNVLIRTNVPCVLYQLSVETEL